MSIECPRERLVIWIMGGCNPTSLKKKLDGKKFNIYPNKVSMKLNWTISVLDVKFVNPTDCYNKIPLLDFELVYIMLPVYNRHLYFSCI